MTENAIDTDNNESDDEESAPKDFGKRQKVGLTRKSCCSNGTLSGSYHLVRRLTRFLRIAGMAEFGEDMFNISKFSIFQPGPSQTKDQVCKVKDHHASHVVRLKIAPDAAKVGPFHDCLKKYLGHTHCVHRKFNLRIGKEIDTLQGKMLPILLSINWRKENPNQLSAGAANVLNTIKNEWLKLLKIAIATPSYHVEQFGELGKAVSFIEAMSLNVLYRKTRVGIDYMLAAEKIRNEIGEKIKIYFESKNKKK
uniref:(northern house mosquito) hypothetical protein n=1 Tax=Culex pipiens TaxID=7175 RepID=A0A8D8GFF6_CULPI